MDATSKDNTNSMAEELRAVGLPGTQLGKEDPSGLSRGHGIFTGNDVTPPLSSTVQSGSTTGVNPRDVDKDTPSKFLNETVGGPKVNNTDLNRIPPGVDKDLVDDKRYT